jgi:nucleotide-binding universal stress UspA family protein
MFHKILVALDDSELSEKVLAQAIEFAQANKSEMTIAHVLSMLDEIYPGTPYVGMPQTAWESYQKKWIDRENTTSQRLHLAEQQAVAAGLSTKCELSYGDPGKTICALAQTSKTDLIIVGRRGLNGLNELLTGSTSSYILHHAPCDVLTIQTAR